MVMRSRCFDGVIWQVEAIKMIEVAAIKMIAEMAVGNVTYG